jgi:hypothetical protein
VESISGGAPPTEARDHATLTGTFAALLGGAAISARGRERIPARELAPLSYAPRTGQAATTVLAASPP